MMTSIRKRYGKHDIAFRFHEGSFWRKNKHGRWVKLNPNYAQHASAFCAVFAAIKRNKASTITDSRTGERVRVCRTYRTTDGSARLRVTTDRKIWLDYTDGAENMVHVGDMPEDMPITRQNVRKAANQ